MLYTQSSLRNFSITLMKYMRAGLVGTGFDMLYHGFQCDVGEIELLACLPEEWKKLEDNEEYTNPILPENSEPFRQ